METRAGRKKPRKPASKKRIVGYTLLFFAFMIFAGAGYYAYSFYDFANNISKPNTVATADQYDWTGTDRINIAMFGVDARGGETHPRSDTIMILSIDPKTKTAALFSVMRDTYYKVPGYGFRKINEAFALGGPGLAIDTLKKYLQIQIPYYVKTDFNGFAKIVDSLGGIDMYVEKDMYHYDDGIYNINLKKGQQHLDGQHALMYVRYRSDSSDYVRTERQRHFLTTLASEMKSTNAVVRLPDVLKSVQGDIETNMTFSDMLKIGKLAGDLNLASLQSQQLPPLNDSTGTKAALLDANRDGASVIIPDVYETRLLVHKILNDGKTVVRTYDDQEPMVAENTPTTPSTHNALPTPPAVPKTDQPATTPGTGSGVKPDTGGPKTGDQPKPGGSTSGGKNTGGTPGGTTGGNPNTGTGTNTGGTGTGTGVTPGTGSGAGTGSPATNPKPPSTTIITPQN